MDNKSFIGGTHPRTPQPQSWATELEKLALTEPDPNQAVYNLPQLKAFIAEQISKARAEGKEKWKEIWLPLNLKENTAATLHTIRERIEKMPTGYDIHGHGDKTRILKMLTELEQ